MADNALLDNAAYSAPPAFQAERRRIFGAGWQVVGPTAGFPDAGSYAALGLGGWPLIVMRGGDGVIRAFHNVCAHQKMPVLDNGRGRCDQLRCRYHGWTYNAEGALISAPAPVSPGDDLEDYALDALPAATARGLVFASLDEDVGGAPDPGTGFADLDALTLVADETRSLMPNWKAVLDVVHGGPAAAPVSDHGRFTWIRPVTGLWQEPDGTVMLLVVPRTFRKTELHVFALAKDAARCDALVARADAWTGQIIAAATARQEAVDAGASADPALAERLAPIHGWIRASLTKEPAT